MKITILDTSVLDFGDIDWSPISSLGDTQAYGTTAPCDTASRLEGADVIITNKVRLHDPAVLETAGRHGRLVCMLSTGYDCVDTAGLAALGIPVCNVTAYGTDDVAQHSIAMLLELCRGIGEHSADVRAGGWHSRSTWCYWLRTPVVLSGLTMGIIGFGTIGRRVGEIAHALGMNILGNSRSRSNAPALERFAFADLDEIFAKSDVISLHCPLTEETRGLVCADSIARMKDGVFVVNAARGPLLNEEDCAQALKSGKMAGLATDVLGTEPPSADNPLVRAPNCVITPHMAWASRTSRQNIVDLTAANIRAWMNGVPRNVVNAPVSPR